MPMTDIPTCEFSTDSVAPAERVDYWNALASGAIVALESRPVDPRRFSGSIRTADLGEIKMFDVASGPAVVRHTQAHVAASSVARYLFCVNLDGKSRQRQMGREDVLRGNDLMLIDTTRPYELFFGDSNRMLVVAFEQKLLERRMADCEAMVGRRLCADHGLNTVVSDFIRAFWKECNDGASLRSARRVTDGMLDLISSALISERFGGSIGDSARPVKRLQQVINYIDAYLTDPGLTPSRIASHCGMTPRYLHLLFGTGDESVVQFVTRRRLEECARLLSDGVAAPDCIATLARDFGFGSPTHFGRVFRARFGLSPGDYRDRARCLS